MANPEDIERAAQGVDAWNAWATTERNLGRSPAVDFSDAQIQQKDFERFIFPGPASFTGATFIRNNDRDQLSFNGATFLGDTYFVRATFSYAVDFQNSKISGHASFLGATFDGDVNFGHALFSNGAVFSGARFLNRAWFVAANFNGDNNPFNLTRFARVPDFRVTRFSAPPEFHGTRITYNVASSEDYGFWRGLLNCASSAIDAERYRRLKQLSAESKDHERELMFFAYELRAKRFHETTGVGPIALNLGYDWLSDYGRSTFRPLVWFASSLMLSTAVIAHTYSDSPRAMLSKFAPSLVLAFTNATLLLGSDKWELRKEGFEALCGSCKPQLGLVGDLLAYAQSSFSLLLILLIGLALRNRFRIGGSG